jgi:histidine triad (HIT) family protein
MLAQYNQYIMSSCVICQLVNNELPSWVIFEDEKVFCFLPLRVEAFGHTVIAPKEHHTDLFSVPPEVLNYVLGASQRVAMHYQSALGTIGINLLHASGVAAQQSVPHLHMHLIPRFDNDNIDAWPKLPGTNLGMSYSNNYACNEPTAAQPIIAPRLLQAPLVPRCAFRSG